MDPPIRRRRLLVAVGTGLVGTAARAETTAAETGSWSQFQADATNTGVNAAASGPATGVAKRWVTTPTEESIDASVAVADGTVFFGSWDDRLYAVDAASGETKWKRDLGHSVHFPTPAVAGGRVFVGTGEGRLLAVDAANGRIRWHYDTGDAIRASATVRDDAVYVANTVGTVAALNAEDGTERWRFEPSGIQPVLTTPAVTDDAVYVTMLSFDELPEEEDGLSSPHGIDTIAKKAKVDAVSGESILYAIDRGDGTERWRSSAGELVFSSPVATDDTVFLSGWDRTLAALATEDGSERWSVTLPGPTLATPVAVDDALYVGVWDGIVEARSKADGSKRWEFTTPSEQRIVTSPTTDGETLYVPTDDELHALRLDDGRQRWVVGNDGHVVWPPAIGDGAVYASGKYGVFALESGSSRELEIAYSGSPGGGFDPGERGFFTNDGDSPLAALGNPFVLTVGGFVLSVVGIVYQLLSGE